ncbi:unnamed protein product [Gadus morhua 'NCC']
MEEIKERKNTNVEVSSRPMVTLVPEEELDQSEHQLRALNKGRRPCADPTPSDRHAILLHLPRWRTERCPLAGVQLGPFQQDKALASALSPGSSLNQAQGSAAVKTALLLERRRSKDPLFHHQVWC